MVNNVIFIACIVLVMMYMAGVTPDDVARTATRMANDASTSSFGAGHW